MIAATGDDKVNLVVSLLAKTEYGVPRTVARVNNPKNEWLFNEAWGVDVAVSTPRLMSALVEEAVSVGDLVRLFTFRQGNANLRRADPAGGLARASASRVGDVPWPQDTALVAIIRDGQVDTPDPGRPARGRRRAAVRGQPRHGSAARGAARPARPLTGGGSGSVTSAPARRAGCGCGPSSQAIAASGGHLQRPAQRDLR